MCAFSTVLQGGGVSTFWGRKRYVTLGFLERPSNPWQVIIYSRLLIVCQRRLQEGRLLSSTQSCFHYVTFLFVPRSKKGMVLYSAVSSPLDRSKRFTLSSPGRPVHSDTVLGFSWKHSSHAAIAQRLFTHISTTVYSQVLIYTAESTEAS